MSSPPDVLAAINPRVRLSPVFDRTVAAGLATVSVYNHMWLPTGYGDPDAEYRRLTETVAIWDVSAQRHIEVSGPDATALVDRCTVIGARDVVAGTSAYAPMVDHHGILINDPILIRTGDQRWRFSIADGDVGLWLHALAHADGHRADVRELPTATIAVQGPLAPDVAARLGLDLLALQNGQHRSERISGVPITLSRTGWSSQEGFELFIDDEGEAGRVWDEVLRAGVDLGMGPGAPDQAERIESGLLSYGTDTGYEADPFELGLGDLVDFESGDFIGRDALRRIEERGPSRRLVGCVISGDAIETFPRPLPISTSTITGDSHPDEQLRIAVWSPSREQNIGLCLVAATRDLDQEAAVAFPDGDRTLRFSDFPFRD